MPIRKLVIELFTRNIDDCTLFLPAVPTGHEQMGLPHVPGVLGFSLTTFPVQEPPLKQKALPDGVQAFEFEFPSEQVFPLISRQHYAEV